MKPFSFPKHLEIEVTNHCNLKCKYCPYDTMTREKGHMSLETVDKIIKDSGKRVNSSYLHVFGEPLLHPKIDTIINKLSPHMRTSLSTNCVLLDWDMSNRILDSNLDEIILSLDSLNPDTYYDLRGWNFNQVYEHILGFIGLRRKKESNCKVIVSMIEMQDNEDEIEEFKNKFKTLLKGIGETWIKPFTDWTGKVKDNSIDGVKPRRFNCNKPFKSLVVYWNGDVSICCRDVNGEAIVGNIHKNSLKEIWDNEKYKTIRECFNNKKFDKIPLCKEC